MNPEETGWEGDEDSERWFFEAQEALKADAEAYWSWCSKIEREVKENENA
jgi:hypothetical protein